MSAPRSLLAARIALRAPCVAAVAPSASSLAGSSRASSTEARQPFEARRPFNPPPAASGPKRQPRPRNPNFFTTKEDLTTAILSLQSTRISAEARLREERVWPLPKTIPHLDAPATAWKSRDAMNMLMRSNRDFDKLLAILTKLNHMRYVAETMGVHDVAGRIATAIEPYQRSERVAQMESKAAAVAAREAGYGIDELGRAYAIGRRKSSSARVWVVPSEAARSVLAQVAEEAAAATPAVEAKEEAKEGEVEAAKEEQVEAKEEAEPVVAPKSEFLINHLPLPIHFHKLADRDVALRPLRVTGLLGAFNIFASVRGGGTTGQSGAIAHALAQAVSLLRPETRDVLFNDGLLNRDVRVVERKKTNRPKARKGYTWVKR